MEERRAGDTEATDAHLHLGWTEVKCGGCSDEMPPEGTMNETTAMEKNTHDSAYWVVTRSAIND